METSMDARFNTTQARRQLEGGLRRKLGKCFVDVETFDRNGAVSFLLNAYEQSSVMWCMSHLNPKAKSPMLRMCMDSDNKFIDPEQADKRIDQLMRE